MNNKEALERTKELTKVNPVAEMEPLKEEPSSVPEKEKETSTPKKEEPKEYDKDKYNRLMMEFDANEIDEDSPRRRKEKKKTSILLLILLIGIIAVGILLALYINGHTSDYDYKSNTNIALNEIYSNNKTEHLEELLTNIKSDENKIKYLHQEALENSNNWISLLSNNDYNDLNEFKSACSKLRTTIELLYNTKIDSTSALTENDYNTLINKLSVTEKDGTIYYQALEKFNNKEYEEAYNKFKDITEDNLFYKKAQPYIDKAVMEMKREEESVEEEPNEPEE